MVYVKKTQTHQDINFLKGEGFISFTRQVDETAEGIVKGVSPTGSVFPKNDTTAGGITINDVDMSNGSQPVGVIAEGHALTKRLPAEPSSGAQEAMCELKSYDTNGKMLAVPIV